MGVPDEQETTLETEDEYCDDVELFSRDSQAMYLIELRDGTGDRRAARAVGFTPRAVKQFRKNTPVFEEECQEAIEEAKEEVLEAIRSSAIKKEPWAARILSEKYGWKGKDESGSNTTTNNILLGSGNTLERLAKLQTEALRRAGELPDEQLVPARVIDVSLADD